MNLQKLFETQRELDAKILLSKGLVGHDLLDEKILALQVELGELANEWRGFKFWSEDQKPKPPKHNWRPSEDGMNQEWLPEWGYESYPLLEEYVDCLHFILLIGNDLGINDVEVSCNYTEDCTTGTFNKLFENVGDFRHSLRNESRETTEDVYKVLFELFVGLGELHLGFTWEQIEQAYYEKNEINHERQANGY